jgi:hypothetical protein
MVQFPAPIGGTVLPDDFAPSILFAVVYALLVPLMLYRILGRRSRCIILIGTVLFSVERHVVRLSKLLPTDRLSIYLPGSLYFLSELYKRETILVVFLMD